MRHVILQIAAFVVLPVLLAGCGTQTVLVNPGTPVRLAEPVAAKVYVPASGGGWIEGAHAVQLPAGWYVLPPPTTRPAGAAMQ